MARNIQIREPGNNYADVLHPETNSGMVRMANGKTLQNDFDTHKADYATHKADYATHKADYATHKADVEGALTELFTSVSNGKNLVGTAITDVDSNVTVPTNPTFQDLANAIGQISAGKKWANGVFPDITLSGTGATKVVTITGLAFRPSIVIVTFNNCGNNDYLGFFVGFIFTPDNGVTVKCCQSGSMSHIVLNNSEHHTFLNDGFSIKFKSTVSSSNTVSGASYIAIE